MGRRVKRFLIAEEVIPLLFLGLEPGVWVRSEGGAPPDCKFAGLSHNPLAGFVEVYLEHESFPESEWGVIPADGPLPMWTRAKAGEIAAAYGASKPASETIEDWLALYDAVLPADDDVGESHSAVVYGGES